MAPYFFRSGLFFNQLIELCFTSYPSPIDAKSPVLAKLLLHIIAGSFEYVASSWLADISAVIISLGGNILGILPATSDSDVFRDWSLAVLLALVFFLRAKRIVSYASRQGRGITLRSFLASLFWHTPTLLCHGVFCLWAHYMGTDRVRLLIPRWFWVLVAPTYEMGELQLEAMDSTVPKGLAGFKSTWYSALVLYLVRQLVKYGPSWLIHTTLDIQSWRLWSSTTSKPDGKQEEFTFGHGTNPYTSLYLVLSLVISGTFRVLERIASQIDKDITSTFSWIFQIGYQVVGYIVDLCVHRVFGKTYNSHKTNSPFEDGPRYSGFIRLLRIHPGLQGKPIRCSLQFYYRYNMPAYTAISYCWGYNSRTHEIIVNGVPIKITKSAFEVLSNMRSNWKSQVIWLDAICINQTDTSDKEQQIPLMPDIYSDAKEVVVWLGKSKTSDLAVSLVNRLFLINRLQETAKTRFPYLIPIDAARALKRMLKRGWFGRVWVVQEVVQPKVTVRYGNSSIDWQRLSWFTQAIRRDPTLFQMLSSQIGYSGVEDIDAFGNVALMRRFACVKNKFPPLSMTFYLAQMFRSGCKFNAKYDCDRIYGLLGLMKFLKHDLKPGYKMSMRELYIKAVENSIVTASQSSKLDFLNHAGSGYRSSISDLPSWVPDWSINISFQPIIGSEGGSELLQSRIVNGLLDDAASLASFAQFDNERRLQTYHEEALERIKKVKNEIQSKIYNATPGTTSQVTVLPNDVLELQGYRFDSLVAVGKELPVYNPDDWEAGLVILKEWIDLALLFGKGRVKGSSQDPVLHTFSLALQYGLSTCQLDYTFSSAPKLLRDSIIPENSENFWNSIKLFNSNDMTPEVEQALKPAMYGLHKLTNGRCFGVSKSGYMGLFLTGSKTDDWICLFSGARLPFNVRLTEGDLGDETSRYKLIGPAYVEGIMYGVPTTNELSFEAMKIV